MAMVMGRSGRVGRIATHLTLVFLVLLWTVPTFGLFVSSFRDKDQLIVSGWWESLTTTEQTAFGRTGATDDQVERNGQWVIEGNFLDPGTDAQIITFSDNQRDLTAFQAGETLTHEDGSRFTLFADGRYEWTSGQPFDLRRGDRIFYVVEVPPIFTLANYREVLASEGIGQSFINTLTVTVPATIIPIMMAAFAAYTFAWMQFPGRQVLFAIVVGLLVVPLQMSLIPR